MNVNLYTRYRPVQFEYPLARPSLVSKADASQIGMASKLASKLPDPGPGDRCDPAEMGRYIGLPGASH